jgi:hypothetical protein
MNLERLAKITEGYQENLGKLAEQTDENKKSKKETYMPWDLQKYIEDYINQLNQPQYPQSPGRPVY